MPSGNSKPGQHLLCVPDTVRASGTRDTKLNCFTQGWLFLAHERAQRSAGVTALGSPGTWASATPSPSPLVQSCLLQGGHVTQMVLWLQGDIHEKGKEGASVGVSVPTRSATRPMKQLGLHLTGQPICKAARNCGFPGLVHCHTQQ